MYKQIFTCYILLLLVQQLAGQSCLSQLGCPPSPGTYCDLTPNDTLLWKESYWWDAGNQSHDLADVPVTLSFNFTDTCGGALTIYYLLFLDLDGDNIRETVVDSRALPGDNTVSYGNGPDAPYDDGTPRVFDERPLPAGQLYRFALETTQNANNFTSQVRWNTADAPLSFVDPLLPYGNHLIRWVAEKPGGEQIVCEYAVEVRDCKPPTIVCINGLTINIMPTGLINVWATDFLQYTEDNATSAPLLQLGIRKSGTGTGFPVDGLGVPLTSLTFDCTELGIKTIELWARDAAGNSDYCETYLIVQDDLNNCGNGTVAQLAYCARQWCSGAAIAGLEFSLAGGPPGWPGLTLNNASPDPDGCFSVQTIVPIGNLYVLTATLDNDPINGVTALDLIRISQHILGLQPLTPYGLIAADANKSNSVTGFDILEIRKLILGIYTELPNNTSWRFIDADFVFPNPLNPFVSQLPEATLFNSLTDTTLTLDYFGIKIGDVDCSGSPGFSAAPEARGVAQLTLPDQVLAPGEVIEVPLCGGEAEVWLGFQFGLQFDPELLAIEAVTPGDLPNWDAGSVVQPRAGQLNAVWFDVLPHALKPGTPLLTLRLRALQTVQLSRALSLSDGHLPAQAYNAEAEARTLQLAFTAPKSAETVIFPPQPNPTSSGAQLTVYLAEPATVEYQLLDLTGRVLLMRRQPCEAGIQQLELPATAFPGAGVYGWRVRCGTVTKSGKLVRQ